MATRTGNIQVLLNDRIDILNNDTAEGFSANQVFSSVSTILKLVKDKRTSNRNDVRLANYCFDICEAVKNTIQGKNSSGPNQVEREKAAMEDLERVVRRIGQAIRRGTSAPHANYNREEIKGHMQEVRRLLGTLNEPGSPLIENGEHDSHPMPANHSNAATSPAPDSVCGRLIRRAFSPQELPFLVEAIFSSQDEGDTIDRLQGDNAQKLIDVMDEALSGPGLSLPIRMRCLKLLYRTCGRCVLLPKTLEIPVCYDRASDALFRGGYADVWKGEHRGRDVAVKVIRLYSTSDLRKIIGKFCKEVVTWKFLRHPNVLPLLGVAMSETRFAMISDWMGNGNINDFVKAHPNLDRRRLLVDVARGLIYIHDNGMVHGDLKGANVLIDGTGRALITDFGLLTIISDPANLLSSSSNVQGGTVRWMSPELIAPDQFGLKKSRPTMPSDCYALGMVIYETITGRLPFHRDTDYVISLKVVRGERPPRRLKFTNFLWGMLEQCWESQPGGRPSAEDILCCLEISLKSLAQPVPEFSGESELDDDDWDSSDASSAVQYGTRSDTMAEWNHIIDPPPGVDPIGPVPDIARPSFIPRMDEVVERAQLTATPLDPCGQTSTNAVTAGPGSIYPVNVSLAGVAGVTLVPGSAWLTEATNAASGVTQKTPQQPQESLQPRVAQSTSNFAIRWLEPMTPSTHGIHPTQPGTAEPPPTGVSAWHAPVPIGELQETQTQARSSIPLPNQSTAPGLAGAFLPGPAEGTFTSLPAQPLHTADTTHGGLQPTLGHPMPSLPTHETSNQTGLEPPGSTTIPTQITAVGGVDQPREENTQSLPTSEPQGPKVDGQPRRPEWTVPPKILLVGESGGVSKKLLEIHGCTTSAAADGASAADKMRSEKYDLVIMGNNPSTLDGIAVTSTIRQFNQTTPIILISDNVTPDVTANCNASGVSDTLQKPPTEDGLVSMLEKHLTHLKVSRPPQPPAQPQQTERTQQTQQPQQAEQRQQMQQPQPPRPQQTQQPQQPKWSQQPQQLPQPPQPQPPQPQPPPQPQWSHQPQWSQQLQWPQQPQWSQQLQWPQQPPWPQQSAHQVMQSAGPLMLNPSLDCTATSQAQTHVAPPDLTQSVGMLTYGHGQPNPFGGALPPAQYGGWWQCGWDESHGYNGQGMFRRNG